MARFNGFPKTTLRFLKELEKNNNRDWFHENKPRYEDDVLAPALAFVEAMSGPLKKISPHFTAIAKRTGGSVMRIYRDTRFSKDKTPYKTNVGIHFRHEVGKDVHAPGFYLHIAPNEIFLGAGIWKPANPDLNKIRELIDDDPARWKRAKAGKAFKAVFECDQESLKRPPRGYDELHPLIDELKLKNHICMSSLTRKEIESPDAVKVVAERLKHARPMVRFLCDALRLPF